jgi:predicted nucleic acid-binding protein
MNGKISLDTNIIIDYTKRKDNFLSKVDISKKRNIIISIITQIELLCFKKLDLEDEIYIKFILNNFEIIPLEQNIALIATSLRREKNLKIPDAIIVSTAVVHNAVLITNDAELLALKWPGLEVRSTPMSS